ncbi:hypothetical protein TWF481_000154 [Arthrobotrys musiformis]|uniref:Uncharacterized protein n=1 Tax=Arthrobotrys musiformis TaxID=47236 RepID=A0AAV9WMW5_9PEZI
MPNYSVFFLSLIYLAHRAQPYQIGFGGWEEVTEIPWENIPYVIDKTNPPCMSTGDEDVMDVWVRSTASATDRNVPPYIAMYAPSFNANAPGCMGVNIIHVFAYYDAPGKMQSIATTLPEYTGYWREIYPEFMPDDPATQLIEGAGLAPGEVLNLDLAGKVYVKPDYGVTIHDYDTVPGWEGYEGSESEQDEYWSAAGGDYDNEGFDNLSQMSPNL